MTKKEFKEVMGYSRNVSRLLGLGIIGPMSKKDLEEDAAFLDKMNYDYIITEIVPIKKGKRSKYMIELGLVSRYTNAEIVTAK